MDINEARQIAGESMQYIGARYVPKFYKNSVDPNSIEWEADVAYEPITVVSYLYDSYTSKIPVPATVGNPADNPHYWARTGQFNAAIAALQEEMQAVKLRVTDLETQNGTEALETTAQTLSGAINELNGEVESLDETVSEHSETLVPLVEHDSNGLSMITDYLFMKNLNITDVAGDGKKIVQGSAYNSVTDNILVSFINDDDTSCTLVLLESDCETVLSRATLTNLGHCNDMTYNPKTRRYYVCNAKTTDTNNTIAVIKEDLTLDRIITLAGSEVAGDIAYDEDNDRYVVVTGGTVQIYDSEFELVEEYEYDFKHIIKDSNSGWSLLNSINFYKGELYINFVKGNFAGLGAGLSGGVIVNFDLKAKKVKRANVVVMPTPVTELEGLITMGDSMYAIGGGNVYFFMAKLVFQTDPYLHIGNNSLYAGVELPANTNLNDVITAGKYFINSTNIASLSNCPFNATAFATLFVMSAGPSGLIQILNRLDNYPCFYFRIIATSGVAGTWHSIGAIAHGNSQIKIQNFVVPAFVSGGGKEFYICLPFGNCTDLTMSAVNSLSFTITARADGHYLSDGVNNNAIKSGDCNILERYVTKQGIHVKLKRNDDTAFVADKNNYGAVCELDATLIP